MKIRRATREDVALGIEEVSQCYRKYIPTRSIVNSPRYLNGRVCPDTRHLLIPAVLSLRALRKGGERIPARMQFRCVSFQLPNTFVSDRLELHV